MGISPRLRPRIYSVYISRLSPISFFYFILRRIQRFVNFSNEKSKIRYKLIKFFQINLNNSSHAQVVIVTPLLAVHVACPSNKLEKCRTTSFANTFVLMTSRNWNSLPASIFSNSYNLQTFKTRVHKHHASTLSLDEFALLFDNARVA